MDSRRAWIMWLTGVGAYAVAVLQRTSFGVAGPAAVERFDAPAGLLSTFVVLQLLVYASMQIPAGLLVDRLGSRVIVASGAMLMFLGQLNLSFAESLPSAMVARVLVGMGDAMTFTSVLRIIPGWFSPRRIPLLTQLTGLLGQTGQLLSAMPLVALLTMHGWTTAFLAAALTALVSSLTIALVLRNRPAGTAVLGQEPDALPIRKQIQEVWSHPATRLGFWTHWVSGFAPTIFAMMWGFPYLRAEGVSPQGVGALFTLFVLAGVVFGPLLGVLTQRHPLRRSNLALTVVALNALPWLVVILWPGPAPIWLLVLLVIGLSSGGPGSTVGFDFARTANPRHRIGTATGVVIMGAFTASLLNIFVVGVLLDLLGHGAPTLTHYRLAMSSQFVFFAVGLTGLFLTRRKVRARMATEKGIIVPSWRHALRRELRRFRVDDLGQSWGPRWVRRDGTSGPEPDELDPVKEFDDRDDLGKRPDDE